jgi:fumarate reductase subunit C
MSKRRPYVRSMDGWWKKNPFFIEYVLHESTAIFVLAYALVLLGGLVCLGRGEASWNAWLEFLKSAPVVALHLILLVEIVYHAFSWFKLLPVTLPPIRLGNRPVQAGLLVKGGVVASIASSILLFALIRGLAS